LGEIVSRGRKIRSGCSGSIFTTLLAGVALVAAISYMTTQIVSGPVAAMQRTTKKTMADQQMNVISKLVIADASGTDCDGDNYVEPKQWVATPPAGSPANTPPPTNGGFLPTTLGLPLLDPWGTPYGYCVWDTGLNNNPVLVGTDPANCPANAKRLMGQTTPTVGNPSIQTVVAVISAGPDRKFNTTCYNYNAAPTLPATQSATDLVQSSGSDDLVARYTYTQAAQATSSVWQLKPSTAGTAQTKSAQSLEVGDVGSFNAQSGTINALNLNSTGLISAQGGLSLAPTTQVPATCTGTEAGTMAWDTAAKAVRFCNGGGSWIALGSSSGSSSSSSSGTGATDVNGIDHLSDGAAEYTTKKNVALGSASGSGFTPSGDALAALTTGMRNTLAGIASGQSLTSGSDNTGFGYQALKATTTGGSNTAFGHQALAANTVGGNNTAAGVSALAANNTTYSNGITLKYVNALNFTASVTAPGNVAAGDVILLTVAADDGGGGTPTWPAGFTDLQHGNGNCDGEVWGVAWKLADGSEAGQTLTVTGIGGTTSVMLAVYSGAAAAGTINTSAQGFSSGCTATPEPLSASMTTTVANTTNVWIGMGDPNNTTAGRTFTVPAGYVQEASVPADWSPQVLADSIGGAAGATGALSGSITDPGGSASTFTVVIALKPVVAATTTPGTDNTAAGYQALATNMGGQYNTAAGFQSGYNVLSGSGNTYAGYLSGYSNGAGNYNTGAGYKALYTNTGSGETAAGYRALALDSSGSGNTVAGYFAAPDLTSGNYNAAAGFQTLLGVQSGSGNTAVGSQAMGGACQAVSLAASDATTNCGGGPCVRLTIPSTAQLGVTNDTGACVTVGDVGGVNGISSGATYTCSTRIVSATRIALGVSGWGGIAWGTSSYTTSGWLCYGNTTTTSRMTGIGYQAMGHQSMPPWEAQGNVAIGHLALHSNRWRGALVAIGDQALRKTTPDNACCGHDGGTADVAFGYKAIATNNLTANEVTAIGYQAAQVLGNPTGTFGSGGISAWGNTAAGFQALMALPGNAPTCCDSSNNLAIGYQALLNMTDAASDRHADVAIGYQADQTFNNQNWGTSIGYQAGMALGTAAGYAHVLIGYKAATGNTGVGWPN
jgi:hypothetical protein